MEDCIFCKIGRGEVPSQKIWEDEFFFAFLDIHPVNPGHILLIPKRHVGYVFDMKDADFSELWLRAKMLAGPLQQATQGRRIGIAVEGFGVDHVHVHLVPINHANELNPERAKAASTDELSDMVENIKKHLS